MSKMICDSMPQLTELNLNGNQVTLKGLNNICSDMKQLKLLHISGFADYVNIASVLADMTQLTNLDISHFHVGPWGCKILSETLKNLSSLNVNQGKIGLEGIKYLSNNQIGDEGAKYIGELTNLTHLQISSNSIGDEGVKSIGNLTKLTNLEICANLLGDQGVIALANIPRLETLEAKMNPNVGEEAALRLLDCPYLKSLSLPRDHLSEEIQKQCTEKWKRGWKGGLFLTSERDWDEYYSEDEE